MNKNIMKMALTIGVVVTMSVSVSATPKDEEDNDKANYVAVYNPNTGQIEYRTCPDFPDCYSQEIVLPEANTDQTDD